MPDVKVETDKLYSEAVAYVREDEGGIHAFKRVYPILERIARLASNLPDAKINRYDRETEQITTCEIDGYRIEVMSTLLSEHLILSAPSEKGTFIEAAVASSTTILMQGISMTFLEV